MIDEIKKLADLKSKQTVSQELIDWESRLEQKRMIANYVMPEFNSKCCICSMPCNKKGKISICDGGCK